MLFGMFHNNDSFSYFSENLFLKMRNEMNANISPRVIEFNYVLRIN